jgi:DNA-binding transcriptional regulator YiaG
MPTSETTRPPEDEADLPEDIRATIEELVANAEPLPEWLGVSLMDHVRLGLFNLRRYIDDPNEDRISWDFPFVELTYPVEWDFEGRIHPPPGGVVFRKCTAEDLVDGKVPEEKAREVVRERRSIEALSYVTRRVVEWREEGKTDAEGRPTYILPKPLVDCLDAIQQVSGEDSSGGLFRQSLVDMFARPFSMGAFEAEAAVADAKLDAPNPEELEALVRSGTPLSAAELTSEEWGGVDAGAAAFDELLKRRPDMPAPMNFATTSDAGEKLDGSVVALVYPLTVDATARRAWFTLGVGLVFTKGNPRRFSEKHLAKLWDKLIGLDADELPRAETSTTSTKAARSAPVAGPPQAKVERLLLDNRTRIDTKTAQLVGFMDGSALPRKWGRVRTWDELVQDEVVRLREAHGENAFEAVQDIRDALLVRRHTAAGVEVLTLTKEAEEDLLEREGPRGFRRVLKNEDGIQTEFLVKQWRAGGGRIRIRLSWYGLAWPLVAEAREAEEKRLRETKTAAASRLFEELNEDEKRRVDDGLALLGTLKDARFVMDALLRRFGAWGENPVRFPARELRLLLECETDPHGHERVWAALRALQRIEYGYEAVSVGRDMAGKAVGPLVADVVYEAKGKGSHTDGDFYVTLSELALGCLRAFKVAGSRIRDARKVFRFDWAAKLEKDAREGLDFVQGFSALAPYFDRAKGFTSHQTRLRTWLENNLTLRKDATSKGRESYRVPKNAADAGEPRVYTSDFCNLLEPGRRYHAALGHFPKNAETGRKLKGRPQAETATGGARTGGLLEVLGYDLPPGRADAGRTTVAEAALKDLRAVVEEALGGRVVGRRNGQWMTLSEADRVRAEELLEDVSWFLFVADDFRERMHQTIEAHHENRRRRGETDRAVRVTTDRPTYEKALEDRGEAAKGVGLAELRERLYAKRKDRRLSQADVGRVFEVSQSIVASWERGPERKGKAIPENIRPLVLRWIETNEGPTEDELMALAARRRGSRKGAS